MKALSFLLIAAVCQIAAVSAQPAGISYVYGNGQMGRPLTTIAPIFVLVTDQNGKPVANSPVTWTVTQGAPAYYLPPVQTTISDASGYAMSYLPAYAVDPSLSFDTIEVDAQGLAGAPIKFFFTSLATGYTREVLSPSDDQDQTINTTVGALIRGAYQVQLLATDGPQAGLPIPDVGLRVLNVMPGLNTSGYYDFTVGNDPNLPSVTCVNNTLSDSNGTATCDMQVGSRAGTTRLYILLGESRLMPVLTLNVGIGSASAISIIGGSGQTGKPGDVLPKPLSVRVTDSGGNATPGATVGWSVVGGSAALAAATTVTDAKGGSINTVTLGASPGAVRIRAQITATTFADFTASDVLGVSSLQLVSGDNQSALVGTTFSSALVVRAVDVTGAAVANIPVQFSSTRGTLSASTVTTNSSGVAAVTLTAGQDPGPVTVSASAEGFQAVFQKLTIYPPGPRLDVTSLRNAASGDLGLTPCGLATVTAIGLAPGVDGVIRSLDPSATTLGPVDSITIGGIPAFVLQVSNVEGVEAVSIQTPCNVPVGTIAVAATVQGLTGQRATGVAVRLYQPGVFAVDDNGSKVAWATHGDGSLINSISPALRGEVIRVFATGLGPVQADPPTGSFVLGVPANLVLGINDAGVPLVRSGYSTDQPGLYFVEVMIPPDIVPRGTGHADFVIAIRPDPSSDPIYSNTVPIPVR